MEDKMSNEELKFDDLEHLDDWPDAMTRDPELEPSKEGLEILAAIEKRLVELYDTDEVQEWVRENDNS